MKKNLKRAFEKVVQLRTYLGLKKNMTNRVEAALVMFTAAIQRIGRGNRYSCAALSQRCTKCHGRLLFSHSMLDYAKLANI